MSNRTKYIFLKAVSAGGCSRSAGKPCRLNRRLDILFIGSPLANFFVLWIENLKTKNLKAGENNEQLTSLKEHI